MRSTGEVMGISSSFGLGFAKAQLAAGQRLPLEGTVFISVNDRDKRHVSSLVRELMTAGLKVIATRGTAAALRESGIDVESVYKVNEGRPNIVDLIKTQKVNLVINTPLGRESFYDEKSIRRAAIRYNVPCITTVSAANAAARGITALRGHALDVAALQDLHKRKPLASAAPAPADHSQAQTGGKPVENGHLWILLVPIILLALVSLIPLVGWPSARPPDDEHWKGGVFYVNRDDPSLFVPKRRGFGYTLNFGNSWSWLVVALILLAIVIPVILGLSAARDASKFR
jgi:hypothetical protein